MSAQAVSHDRLIITAASQAYGPYLLALLGSLTLNWPTHPPVRVYDIGMDDATLAVLHQHAIEVVKVPAFCPHWRKHFTWKIWCLNDAPAREILWMDAGLSVMGPLDEIFDALDQPGYFLVPNAQLLDWEASEASCHGCGVLPEFRLGKPTLAGTMMGFRKDGKLRAVLQEALTVALTEDYIAATDRRHRHDQAIISLLIYKQLGRVLMSDKATYLRATPPEPISSQKVWVHRRKLLPADIAHFTTHISTPGPPYRPQAPAPTTGWRRTLGTARDWLGRVVTGDPRRLPQRTKRFFSYRWQARLSKKRVIYNGIRD